MKRFFYFNEILHVGRGKRVMRNRMQYDTIQGQGHESKVGNLTIRHLQWQLATDHGFLN